MRMLFCVTTLLAGVALIGCSAPKDTAETPTSTAPAPPGGPPLPGGAAVTPPTVTPVAAGKVVFQANCVGCHGANGMGIGKGKPDFTDAAWQAKESDEELLNSITNGHHKMPAFKDKLTETERENALAYVRTFAAK